MDTVKRFYPVSEVAARFDVTSQTVRNWIAAGRLHSVQPTPGGRYKIPTDELARFERESGSRARGDAPAESDFDLAIVAPDGAARRRVAMRAYESLAGVAGRSVAVDIVVLTPSIITAERDLPGSISRAVAHEGVVLYGSRAALA